MNTKKKSKFQERLDEIAKNRIPEDDRGSMNDQLNLHKMTHPDDLESPEDHGQGSQTAQPPNPAGLQRWKSVHEEKPLYYAPVNIWDGKEVLYNWARVSDGEKEYYVNLEDDFIKFDVTHWSYPFGVTHPKYEPMTEDDIKVLSIRDLNNIISDLEKSIIPLSEMPPVDERDSHLGFNTAMRECVSHLKRVARDTKLKLHNRNTGDLK